MKKDTKISSNLFNLCVTIVQLSYKALYIWVLLTNNLILTTGEMYV